MASAADPLTEDYCCAFCLQRLPYMVDPKQLPCSHVFCRSCLKGDFQCTNTTCRICSLTHNIASIKKLTAPDITDDIQGEEYNILCDVCTGEKFISLVYCSDCKKNYCQQHHQLHDAFLGTTHNMVSTKPTTSNTCQEHADEPLTLACSSCHVTFCTSCARGQHTIVGVEKLANKLRQEMHSELKTLSGKITAVYHLMKSAWNNVDDVETKVKKLHTEVDLVKEKEIKEIQNRSAEARRSFSQYLEKATKDTENQTAKMMLKKESLQNLWRSKHSILNQSDSILIARHRENMAILKDALSTAVDVTECEYSASRLDTDSIHKTLLSIVDTPATPTRLKTVNLLADGSEIVFWSQKGELISAYGNCIQFFSGKFYNMGSQHMSSKIMSLAEGPRLEQKPEYIAWTYESSTPVDINGSSTHNEVSITAWLKRYLYSQNSFEFNESSTLEKYSYNHSSNRYTVTVKSQEFVRTVAINPVRSHILAAHKVRLDVFSMEEDLLYTINLPYSNTKVILVLPDGTLLILSDHYVYNYRYQAPPLENVQIWQSSSLTNPQGISIDAAGCIYVGCEGGIQIFSPAGASLKTLHHQLLRSVKIFDVCVSKSGDKIAVACGEDGLKLFSLSHEEVQ